MTKIRRNLPNNQYLAAILANSPSTSNVFATIADLAGLGGGTVGTANRIQHDVKYAEQINIGQAVYVSSADGTNMIVSKADNSTEATSSKTIGLVTATGNANFQGSVVTEGLLAGLNTSAATIGDAVWLGTNGNLIFWHYGLTTKPVAPNHLVFIGIVTRVNANNGEIFVKVQNGFEIDELHDVSVVGRANNMVLGYNSATSLHEFKTISTWLGYTPVNNTFTIATSGPLSGASDLSGIGMTLSISQANSTTAGYLSSVDWNTFNNKVSTNRTISTTSPLTGGGDLSADRTISIPKATSTVDGYLSATDFLIFYNKQAALGFTPANIAGATFTGDIFATNLLGINTGDETLTTIKTKLGAASSTQDGYLTSADWSTFNSKGSGSVTSVGALTITSNGSDVTSSVTNSTTTPIITLNIPSSSALTRGVLTSTDWIAFNSKMSGSGTVGYLPRFTGSNILSNSVIQDNGTTVGIGNIPNSAYKLIVYGGVNNAIYGSASATNKYGVLGTNISDDAGTYIGGYFAASPADTPINTNIYIGAKIVADGFGSANAYSIQLQDGTENIGKFLKSVTNDGKANWVTMSVADTGLTVTTNGVGAASLSGNVLNIPISSGGAGGFDYGQAYAMTTMTFL